MILAEKIMNLRKKNGWSQEELAAKLNVSRQSVSKWEGAMSVPELDKILQMSRIFEVSTDYLLKDENETEDFAPVPAGVQGLAAEDKPLRRVSMEEARAFISAQQEAAGKIAWGVVLCILSPVVLIFLGGLAENPQYGMRISENAAGGLGVTVLLLMVAAAVAIFIFWNTRLERYEYLEKENFDLEYGVAGMAREGLEAVTPGCTRRIIAGVTLCILSAAPLFLAAVFTENELALLVCVDVLLILVAAAVYLFVTAGMSREMYEKLLQEGEYTARNKGLNKLIEKVGAIYWPLVLALYLCWNFSGFTYVEGAGIERTGAIWGVSWIIWPVAGVIFGAIAGVCRIVKKEQR